MRITQSMVYRGGLAQLNAQRARLAGVQEQAASGLRLNRPSDDPVDYRTTIFRKDDLNRTDQYLRSIDLARTRLRGSESAISDAANALADARVLAISAQNGTNDDPTSVGILRSQAESIFEQVMALANTKDSSGSFLFAGLASGTRPFAQTGSFVSGSPPPTVTFEGDASRVAVEIGEDVYIDVTRDGSEVFAGAADVFAALGTLWQGIDQTDAGLIDTALGEIDAAFDQMLFEQAQIGNAENQANRWEDRLELQKEQVTSEISNLQDADVFQVYSDLAMQEAALQASLQVTGRLLSPTLLDFI